MAKFRGEDQSGWGMTAGKYRSHPTLVGDHQSDWVVIGGGFTGLAAARRIGELDPKARVILVDGKRIAQGASGRNSGFVVANGAPDEGHFANDRERADFDAINALNRDGVGALKAAIAAFGIDCEWDASGTIHAVSNAAHREKIAGYAKRFDQCGVAHSLLDASALKARLGTSFYKYGIENRGGALVQPAMLAKGLAQTLPETVELFENTVVSGIENDGGGVLVRCGLATVRARRVVVGVNGFLPRLGLLKGRVFPLAMTASLTRVLTAQEEAEIGNAAPWGVLAPVAMGATVRLTKSRRLLMRNTGEYAPAGIDARCLIERRKVHMNGLLKRFPWLGRDCIDYTWSGNLGISRNSKPIFTDIEDKIFVAGAYNASGVARGTSMGRLIVDKAMHEPSHLLETTMAITKPTKIPPRPFFDIGVRGRMAIERRAGQSEN